MTRKRLTGFSLLNWSVQWALVMAMVLLAGLYLGQWLLYGALTLTPLYWTAGLFAASLVHTWIGWQADGSLTNKDQTDEPKP